MSIAVKLYRAIETVVNGVGLIAGDRNVAQDLTYAGDKKYDASFSITNSSGDDFNSDVIWASGDGGVDTFGFLWILTDADALIELQNDNSDAVVIQLDAGVPFMLGADELLDGALGADGSATSLANVIDQITVKNNTTGDSANVVVTGRLLLFA